MTQRPVLVLDSGLGGLSVLRALRLRLPGAALVYIADDAAFPYGGWEEVALLAHLRALVAAAVAEHRPALAVIACNTASTLALAALRADHPGLAFVGTVPAIKPAAERTASGLVSVLATPGTVRRAYTGALIESFAPRAEVRLVGSERLARLAEAHLRGHPVADAALATEIRPCFVEAAARRTDIVVLACTHYPFLASRFRKVAPWPVDWLDPAEAIAERAAALLPPPGPRPGECAAPGLAVFTAGGPDATTRRLIEAFGLRAR